MALCVSYSKICAVKRQLHVLDEFLSNYSWLMNSYTTDYFTLNLEKKFPSSFSEFLLKGCSLADLANLLPDWTGNPNGTNQSQEVDSTINVSKGVFPLSMLAFRSLCKNLALNQRIGIEEKGSLNSTVFGGSLEKYFRVCVKAKKRHEVDLLAEMLSELCKNHGCEHVVDIGAGLGHLSRLLSYNKQLRVTTIEATDSHSPKAQRLDKRTESLMTKQKVMERGGASQPNHVSHWIESTITTEEFIQLLQQDTPLDVSPPSDASSMLSDLSNRMANILVDSAPTNSQSKDCGRSIAADLPRFDLPWATLVTDFDPSFYFANNRNSLTNYSSQSIRHEVCSDLAIQRARLQLSAIHRPSAGVDEAVCLSGLHACGDLSTTMIRVFANLPCAKVLSSIGCCYMKLSHPNQHTAASDRADNYGFPMSEYVKSLPHHNNLCSYESLEMGCHFVSQYRQRLLDSEPSLRRHVVRAALQVLLYRRREKSQIQFRRLKIKNSEQLLFKEYAERAFKRLGIEFDVTDAEIKECELMIESHWRAVVGAYTVRLALAPLVEAYILLDRMVYLWEHGISSSLVACFDPKISPRNMAIVAVKDDHS